MDWVNGTLKTRNLRIQVTNKHIEKKGVWVVHIREFNWSCVPLGIPDESTVEEAQNEAVAMVRHHLHILIAELSSYGK